MSQAIAATFPQSKTDNSEALISLFQVIGGSLFLALCSQIQIPLFFTPIPLTLQTFAVMLLGASLGSKKGALSVLLYFAQIAGGLPVLGAGCANPLAFFGPSAGYIYGFVLQAYLVGCCVERWSHHNPMRLIAPFFMISFLQLMLGALWLGSFVGMDHMLAMGLYPFIPGEAIKCFFVTRYLKYQ